MLNAPDISRRFEYRAYDANVAGKLVDLEGLPEAIVYFSSVCDNLSDYAYWFLLSTLWVSYSGYSDLNLWRHLFASKRPGRKKSIMKPSEVRVFDSLPYYFTAFRAHRPKETEWLSYTLDREVATRFARERGVDQVAEYMIKKRDVLALFLRRGESEILVIGQLP